MKLRWTVLAVAVLLIGGVMFVGDGDELSLSEEMEEGTVPLLPDSDFDELDDGEELRLETNPTVPDTDDDGLPDGAEAADSGPVSRGDPLRQDIFIEVDRVEKSDGTVSSVDESELRDMKQSFADAPVQNPSGSTGVTLHVRRDDVVQRDSTVNTDEYWQIRQENYDMKGRGHYYMVLVDDLQKSGENNTLTGFAWAGVGGLVQDDGRGTGRILMHELGHVLGLLPEDYVGIDSTEVSAKDYRSIMNYNYPCSGCDAYRYSSDESTFNDWAYLRNNSQPPPNSNLGGSLFGRLPPDR